MRTNYSKGECLMKMTNAEVYDTGKACSEETHSLRNPVLGAQAPRKKIRNRTLAARKIK